MPNVQRNLTLLYKNTLLLYATKELQDSTTSTTAPLPWQTDEPTQLYASQLANIIICQLVAGLGLSLSAGLLPTFNSPISNTMEINTMAQAPLAYLPHPSPTLMLASRKQGNMLQ